MNCCCHLNSSVLKFPKKEAWASMTCSVFDLLRLLPVVELISYLCTKCCLE